MSEEEEFCRIFKEVTPYLEKAVKSVGEISKEIPLSNHPMFVYFFTRRIISIYICRYIDGLVVLPNHRDHFNSVLEEAIDEALRMKASLDE
jgi:hypothetical protein